MRDTQVIMHMSSEALRALAHYYECTAEILRRRADAIDPPPRRNEPSPVNFFLSIPEFVAEKQRDGADLDSAIDLVSREHGATRNRIKLALEHGRKQARRDRTKEQVSMAIEMRKAGKSVEDIARRLRVRPARAEKLAASADYVIATQA